MQTKRLSFTELKMYRTLSSYSSKSSQQSSKNEQLTPRAANLANSQSWKIR